jgi:galactoside O-acetyltransferase
VTNATTGRRGGARLLRAAARRLLRAIRVVGARQRLGQAGVGLLVEAGVTIVGGERITLGRAVRLMAHTHLWATEHGTIEIGDRTYVGSYTWVVANEVVHVGADVLIAPFCYLQDTDHGFADPAVVIAEQASVSAPIVIEDDVWLGAHVIVTRGVRIGRGAVVGAGSVVTRDVAPFTIVAGAPARVIGHRRRPGDSPPGESLSVQDPPDHVDENLRLGGPAVPRAGHGGQP